MHLFNRYFIIFAITFNLLLFPHVHGNENTTDNLLKKNFSSDVMLKNLIIFPHVRLQIEGRTFAENDAGYRMKTHRIIDLDIFRLNNIVFSLFMNEFLIFNNNSKYLNPKSINYEMDYGNLRWENKYGILSLFADHNCTNIFNENQTKDRQVRWYGIGVRWESYGMRPGQKDIDHIEIINNLHYKFSFSKAISTKVLNYDYLITGNLRYDILKNNFFIPYIEGSLTSLINDQIRFNRYLETGLRMHFGKGDLTPFFGFNHKYDIDYFNTKAVDFYFVGLRMETLLGNDKDIKDSKSKVTSKEMSLFPDFHFRGSYGKYINNDKLNFNTDILIGLDFLSTYKLSPFIYDTLMHNSQKAEAGMFPRYIKQNIEAGISCKLDFIDALIEPYYGYLRSDEGNYYKGYIEKFSTVGLRLISRKMKTGFANNGIDFDNAQNFERINTIDWSVSAERVFNKQYYNYTWEYNISVRWSIFRYDKSIPYISSGICMLADENYDKVYNIESGVRIQSGLQWMLFYRFEYRTAVDPGNGLFRKYNLIGIKFEI